MNRIATVVAGSGRKGVYLATALGLSQPAFSDRMRGRTAWTLADAMRLAEVLNVSLDQLVGNQDLPVGFTLAETEGVPA